MTTAYKLLGQVTPTANTPSNVYITATGTQAIVGTITIHNFSDSNGSYSLTVRPTGDAFSNTHYIIRGGVIPARELLTIKGAVSMNANVLLMANTNLGSVTFNAYGAEIT
jgi:hypothetical protein